MGKNAYNCFEPNPKSYFSVLLKLFVVCTITIEFYTILVIRIKATENICPTTSTMWSLFENMYGINKYVFYRDGKHLIQPNRSVFNWFFV